MTPNKSFAVVDQTGIALSGAPVSQAVRVDNLVYVAGQLPLNLDGNLVGAGDAASQTEQILRNIGTLVAAAGGDLADVFKLTVFVTDLAILGEVLDVRRRFFQPPYPVVSLVQIVALVHPDALLEIEAIAAVRSQP